MSTSSTSPSSCKIDEKYRGERLDIVLARMYPTWSRRELKRRLREGDIKIDGRRSAASQRVRGGEIITFCNSSAPDFPSFALDVIACSERYVYICKPSGQHVVGRFPDEPGTLAHAVSQAYPECAAASPDPRDGGAVHRLDYLTSGIVAFARRREAWSDARTAFSQQRVTKTYLAITQSRETTPPVTFEAPSLVRESPELRGDVLELHEQLPGFAFEESCFTYRVAWPLGPDGTKQRVRIRNDGVATQTTFARIARISPTSPRSLFWLRLHSGFRHQLRVHLAAIGEPIVRDPLYGPAPSPPGALLLHAWKLDLEKCDSGCGPVCAPLPTQFITFEDP